MRGKPWTPEDLARLEQVLTTHGMDAACAAFPERTRQALSTVATKRKWAYPSTKTVPWFPVEEARARRIYERWGLPGLCRAFPHRTRGALHMKAVKAGWRRVRDA